MPCCARGEPAATAVAPPTAARRPWLRRTAALTQWAIPITTLALIPKCPACLAAYILLLSGLGLSFSAAETLRTALIALSIIALAFLLIRAARRALSPRPRPPSASWE